MTAHIVSFVLWVLGLVLVVSALGLSTWRSVAVCVGLVLLFVAHDMRKAS